VNKGIVLGIDFSNDYTQVSVLGDTNEPKALKFSDMGEEYLMPTAVFYNTDIREWAIGTEAVNRSKVENGVFIDKLPEKIRKTPGIKIAGEFYKWEEIIAKYLEGVIKLVINKVNGVLIRNIIISVDDPDENVMQIIYSATTALGYENENVRIINHAESFAYYILNQNKDIWINSVIMVDFNESSAVIRKMFVTKGREPHTVDVKKIDVSDQLKYENLDTEEGCTTTDRILCDMLKKEIDENVVSAIYLNGPGFMKEGWYTKTIDAIYSNRRIFAGNNLIVKGAIYAARELFFYTTLNNYVISCKGRTKVNVLMEVIHRGSETKVKLSKAGVHWYQAGAKTQCILDNVDRANFEMYYPATREIKKFYISLADFPKRDNKTVRVEVSLAYVEESKFVVEIKDIGFGDFFQSSGAVARYEGEV